MSRPSLSAMLRMPFDDLADYVNSQSAGIGHSRLLAHESARHPQLQWSTPFRGLEDFTTAFSDVGLNDSSPPRRRRAHLSSAALRERNLTGDHADDYNILLTLDDNVQRPGLDVSMLNRLEKREARSNERGVDCSICLESLSSGHSSVLALPCSHVFQYVEKMKHVTRPDTVCYSVHSDQCIQTWLRSSKRCPTCRDDIEEAMKQRHQIRRP